MRKYIVHIVIDPLLSRIAPALRWKPKNKDSHLFACPYFDKMNIKFNAWFRIWAWKFLVIELLIYTHLVLVDDISIRLMLFRFRLRKQWICYLCPFINLFGFMALWPTKQLSTPFLHIFYYSYSIWRGRNEKHFRRTHIRKENIGALERKTALKTI